MKTLVVLFAVASVACASLIPLAQSPFYSSVVLNPLVRPLDTADVINARAVHLHSKALEHDATFVHAEVSPVTYSVVTPISSYAPTVYTAPAAVSHQSRIDVHTSPGIVSHSVSAPLSTHELYTSPILTHPTLNFGDHVHLLKKRSISAYAVAPAALSQQSRVDVISTPAFVTHSVAAPLVSHFVAIPSVAEVPTAVSHQSRVDLHSSPAVLEQSTLPFGSNVWDTSVYRANAFLHSHLLKKRSLAENVLPIVHTVPAAVSHQSRVDVISEPEIVAHEVVAPVIKHATPLDSTYFSPAAISHQPSVDVNANGAHVAPVAHAAVWSVPVGDWAHAGLFRRLW